MVISLAWCAIVQPVKEGSSWVWRWYGQAASTPVVLYLHSLDFQLVWSNYYKAVAGSASDVEVRAYVYAYFGDC